MRLMVPLAAVAALCAQPALGQASLPADAHRQAAAEVAAAERAFDAFTAEHGFTAGFLAFTAPDGILFRPDPVNAREHLSAGAPSADTALRWGPYRVGISTSGDLAWDTGPWTYGDNQAHGWFFTIWEQQPDGQWRWALDHGAGSTPDHVPVPDAADLIVDPQAVGAAAGADSWAEVQAIDQALNADLISGFVAAVYPVLLAHDAWASTPDQGPARTPDAVMTALRARPDFVAFEPIGGRASAAGDLAYTYGHARWTSEGLDRRGHYIRVWRRDGPGAGGWRLVYDQWTWVHPEF